jgi:hypothetical protein
LIGAYDYAIKQPIYALCEIDLLTEATVMRNRLAILFAVAGLLIVSAPLFAHHGSAAFENTMVTLKGTVKSWVYSNPHCLLTLEVKGDNGQVVEWISETQAPNVIYPAGYRKNTFKPGDEVTITIQRVKNGRPAGRIMQAVLADGTKLGGIGGPAAGAEAQ